MALRVIEGGGDTTSRFYNCSVCGHRGKWGPTWAWYGSIKQLEEWGAEGVVLVCSDPCRKQHESTIKKRKR